MSNFFSSMAFGKGRGVKNIRTTLSMESYDLGCHCMWSAMQVGNLELYLLYLYHRWCMKPLQRRQQNQKLTDSYIIADSIECLVEQP